MDLNRTRHGEQQHQRRATLGLFEMLILDHGTRVRSHGADIVFLDKAAKKRIRKEVGGDRGMRVFDRWLNSYLVVADDGSIITTARRTRRVKRS
ncbi:hypothetical protein [Limobrevibacterium gyesilva]|uniref:DUF4258 domain-containing protein n=1 Tax=Limobrevibacterium gyesilva TaxID=2991712 RepID=A0AA41YPE4_9PROT|nr:hypothetical protein [Limobrevibacterium gyesilva]MCW3476276.1 hypothetical protein [Limobrevibacterium gyesilva]